MSDSARYYDRLGLCYSREASDLEYVLRNVVLSGFLKDCQEFLEYLVRAGHSRPTLTQRGGGHEYGSPKSEFFGLENWMSKSDQK